MYLGDSQLNFPAKNLLATKDQFHKTGDKISNLTSS